MNRKQLTVILVALVIIGSAGLILINRNKQSWDSAGTKMGDKVFPNFNPNDVAAIHIQGAADLDLVHSNELWMVPQRENYPADFHAISDALIKLKDLKVVEADTVGPEDLARVNLDPPGQGASSGTLVEFKDASGKVIESMIVGKRHVKENTDSHSLVGNEEPDGCYIRLPKNPNEVLLISDPLSHLQPNPASWLNRDFFKIEHVKSLTLASDKPGYSWTIARTSPTSAWKLENPGAGEILDTNKAAMAADVFNMLRFTDVIPPHAAVQTGMDNPGVISARTFDGLSYKVKVGSKTPDGNYFMAFTVSSDNPSGNANLTAKLKEEKPLTAWTYVIGSWVLNPVLRDRAHLMQGSGEENASAAPATDPSQRRQSNNISEGWKPHVIQ